MYCTNCGHEIKEGKFCASCGTKVESMAAPIEDEPSPEGNLKLARDEFSREFIEPEKPENVSKVRTGQTLKILAIVICSVLEATLIACMLITVSGVDIGISFFDFVIQSAILISIILIEIILLLTASIIKYKAEKNAAEIALAESERAREELEEEAENTEEYPVSETQYIPKGCSVTAILRGENIAKDFFEFPFSIGRDMLDDDTVSEVHANINYEDNKLVITDLESANGVYVNGFKISEPTALDEHELVLIGRAMVKFKVF